MTQKKRTKTTAAPAEDGTAHPATMDAPQPVTYHLTRPAGGGKRVAWGPRVTTKPEIDSIAEFMVSIAPYLDIETCKGDERGQGAKPIQAYWRRFDDHGLSEHRYYIAAGRGAVVAAEDDRRIAELKLRCLAFFDTTIAWSLYDAKDGSMLRVDLHRAPTRRDAGHR